MYGRKKTQYNSRNRYIFLTSHCISFSAEGIDDYLQHEKAKIYSFQPLIMHAKDWITRIRSYVCSWQIYFRAMA